MNGLEAYPKGCRKNIRKLMHMFSTDAETVFSMMRMTASLMDLSMEDDDVVRAIIDDCGIDNKGDWHEDSKQCMQDGYC